MKRANELYDAYLFPDAIKAYRKVLKKNPSHSEALTKLGAAQCKIRNYESAEATYAKLVETGNYKPEALLMYGKVLMNNNKIGLAMVQLESYLEKNPSDLLGKLLLRSCNDVKGWQKEKPWFEVKSVEGLNSEFADFSPVPFKNGLVFVSEREKDYINDAEFGWTQRPYLSVFWADMKGSNSSVGKPKSFSGRINTKYHDGPVSFDDSLGMMYFTRVERDAKGKGAINRLKLYSAKLKKKSWTDIQAMGFNNPAYSVAHPSISKDGKRLFFVSDKPGGQGDMDIYMCTMESGGWSEPKSMGDKINTSGREAFPYVKDNILYFSSDGHPGYGGLDLFMVDLDNLQDGVKNLRAPINSGRDDFGMSFTSDEEGFFSSDRPGGIGEDDIYRFKMLEILEKPKTKITGIVEFDKIGAEDVPLSLLNEDDIVVARTKTGKGGAFSFDKLNADESYLLLIEEGEDKENIRVYLTNKDGKKVLILAPLAKGKYKFDALKPDYYDGLKPINEEDESLLTIDLRGQVYEKIPGDYSGGMEVLLLGDDGEILGRVKTDKDGKFIFEKLAPDDEYMFALADEGDDKLKIILLGEDGKILDYAERMKDGKFVYKRLSAEEDVLTLINEDDVVIKIRSTDNFKISNIYYDYGSADINPIAAAELSKLVTILQKNKHIGAKLSSHTDSRGTDGFNLDLSKKRAVKAVEYIMSKGIENSRISGEGFGETKLVNKCANGVECSDEEHAKNRRTEFTIYKL